LVSPCAIYRALAMLAAKVGLLSLIVHTAGADRKFPRLTHAFAAARASGQCGCERCQPPQPGFKLSTGTSPWYVVFIGFLAKATASSLDSKPRSQCSVRSAATVLCSHRAILNSLSHLRSALVSTRRV
jgi:hypothetical protein